jgi:hypothetical protein
MGISNDKILQYFQLNATIFIVVPCILIILKNPFHQKMHHFLNM